MDPQSPPLINPEIKKKDVYRFGALLAMGAAAVNQPPDQVAAKIENLVEAMLAEEASRSQPPPE